MFKKLFIIIIIIMAIIIIAIYKHFYYLYNKIFNIANIEYFYNECIDKNVCFNLGIKNDNINYIENFLNFDLINMPIKKIGIPSSNGFIFKLGYDKKNYKEYSVLKSNIATIDSDNLIYEYIVGLFINKQILKFPCFVETYGIYTYKSKNCWEKFKDNNILHNTQLNNCLDIVKNKDILNIGCVKYLAIMLQYIDNSVSLKEKITEQEFINNELLNVLFQIYFPLSTLSNIFSHDDLNCNNILLTKLDNFKYIEYHYNLNSGDEIVFKSQYIAKIIDYGNSYFIDENNSTEKIYEKICITSGCEDDCYKYSVSGNYKRHVIINFLLNEIVVNISNNINIENEENIKLLKDIQDKNINIILENLVNKFNYDKHNNNNNNNNNNNIFKNYKKNGDLYIYQDGREMQYFENKKNL
jgi:hypothetical protein